MRTLYCEPQSLSHIRLASVSQQIGGGNQAVFFNQTSDAKNKILTRQREEVNVPDSTCV